MPKVPLLGDLDVTLRIVDSGAPLGATFSGGTITIGNDNYGLFHHTQVRIERTGTVSDWMQWADMESVLEVICNKIIDWYRLFANQALVKRVPAGAIRGFVAQDSSGGFAMMNTPYVDASPSPTAADGDREMQAKIQERLLRNEPPSTWTVLHMDAQAELAASSLPTAILLANTGLETLINTCYRTLASADEIALTFSTDPGPGFRSLLKEVNRRAPTGWSNTRLVNLANRVNANRDDVIHGNPVSLRRRKVEESVEALGQLINLVVPAVVAAHKRQTQTQTQ